MKDTFLLDIDDTLLDFCRLEREQLAAVLASFGERADAEIAERFHAINDSLWKALERGEITRERLVVVRFERLKEEFGLHTNAAALSVCFLEAMRAHAYLFDGALPFLQALAARGRLFAVTNGASRVQRSHMETTGIMPYFKEVFISEEVGAQKPSEAYVRHVRDHIPAFDPARTLYIGDSLTSDMVCAKLLGVAFILYRPQGRPEGWKGLCAESYPEILTFADGM